MRLSVVRRTTRGWRLLVRGMWRRVGRVRASGDEGKSLKCDRLLIEFNEILSDCRYSLKVSISDGTLTI